MRDSLLRIVAALFASAATPATIFAAPVLLDQSRRVMFEHAFHAATTTWLIAFSIALLHAVILGLPAYFLARRFRLPFWWASILFGFVIGTVPFAVESWPLAHPQNASYRAWDGKSMVDYFINGKPTTAAWTSYLYGAFAMGMLGAVSGFVAWLVWRFAPACTGSKPSQSAS